MIYFEVLNKNNFPIGSLMDYQSAIKFALENKGTKIVKTVNEYGAFNQTKVVWEAA